MQTDVWGVVGKGKKWQDLRKQEYVHSSLTI